MAGSLCTGIAIAVAVQWIITGSLSIVWDDFAEHPTYLLLSVFLCSTIVLCIGTLLNRLWIAGAVVGAAGLLLSLVDYLKTAINGTPLELADFGLAAQLGQIASLGGTLTPPADFWLALAAFIAGILLLVLLHPFTALSKPFRIGNGILSLTLLLILFTNTGSALIGNAFKVDVFSRMDAAASHNQYGLIASLWRTAVLQDRQPPENYSAEYMNQVLARLDEILSDGAANAASQSEETVQPNIIMILSESFFDVTTLPDIQYDSDPVKNFHALQSESISGRFHSHYLGYGTGYIEIAMLTGFYNWDFGSATNVCFLEDDFYSRLDALPKQYGEEYQCELLHGYDNSLYNRTVTYPLMGFENLYFETDIQNFDFPWEGSRYGGYYLNDRFLFQGVLNRMENINADGKRAFLYTITMENHQPFNAEKFQYACQVGVSSDVLNEDDLAIVRVLTEGVTRADQALGELTNALLESEEPTIVVFFGDHRPNLFMTDGDTVYTELGLCPGDDTTKWTLEQINDLYATDYLIWANDAALLQGQSGTQRDSSVTAVGSQLLELTGQTSSRWWALLERLSEVSLVQTDLYFVDGTGTAYRSAEEAPLSDAEQELLELRQLVTYDTFYGEQYITAQMNDPVGS